MPLVNMTPLMDESLIMFEGLYPLIGILVLVFLAIVNIRQGHVGRPSIVANVVLLWQIFYPRWYLLPSQIQLYLNVGTIIAIIAGISYFAKISLPTEYYKFAFIGYSAFSILIIISTWNLLI